MLEVIDLDFDDLSDDEQEEQPDNGCGNEDASYIAIFHGGRRVAIFSDAMEPEDCTFNRDMRWIKGAILKAYELGKGDG
jgi:hypothetical protein